MEKARKGKIADKPGEYAIIPSLSKPFVDPGEDLILEFYFAGYGNIKTPKFAIYPSSGFFDDKISKIEFGIKKNEEGKLIFGGQSRVFDAAGVTIILQGVHFLDEITLFFDVPENAPMLATEQKLIKAPIEVTLAIKQKIRPGKYYTTCVFSYFNGKKWCAIECKVEFFVRTWAERHKDFAVAIAILAGIVGFTGLVTFSDWLIRNFL
jgi:hypothetical protein